MKGVEKNLGELRRGYLYVVGTGVLSGMIVVFGRVFGDLGLSLFEMSLVPTGLAGLCFGLWLLLCRDLMVGKRFWLALFFYGVASGATVIGQFGGVILGVPIAVAALLLYTQPIWTVVFEKLFLKEAVGGRKIFLCLLVLLGAVVLVNPFGEVRIENWWGVVLGLMGGIGLSGWVVTGSYLSKGGVKAAKSIFYGDMIMTVLLLAFYPVLSAFVFEDSLVKVSLDHGWEAWGAVLFYVFVTQFLASLWYLKGVEKVKAVDAGVILLLEPVSGAFFGWLVYEENLSWNVFVGGGIILLANYLVIVKEKGE